MSKRVTYVTLALTAVIAFLVGTIFAGGLTRSAIVVGTPKNAPVKTAARPAGAPSSVSLVNFADVVERINPAVVNIDATTRGRETRGRRGRSAEPDQFDGPFDFGTPRNHDQNAPH